MSRNYEKCLKRPRKTTENRNWKIRFSVLEENFSVLDKTFSVFNHFFD